MTKVQVDSNGKVILLGGKALVALAASEGSGGSGGSGEFLVQVIDYDGTVLKSEKLDTGATFTLPSQPSHTGLTFQSWSSPVTIADNTVTVTNSDITIGATYTTASGLSEFDITLTEVTGLSVILNMDGTKDWGDGTSDTSTTHTYVSTGDYTITCDGSTMNVSNNGGLFVQNSNSNNNYYVRDIRLGSSVTSIGGSAFQSCYSLTSITIPEGVTSIGGSAFESCYSLTSITIPEGVTSLNYAFSGCHSLTSITIPEGVTSIGNNTFQNCYSLTSITIPEGVTSIDYWTFNSCYSLTSITIPEGVTSIGDNAFQNCYSLTNIAIPSSITINPQSWRPCIGAEVFYNCGSILEYDFSKHTTIPDLYSPSVFNAINKICKIYVPWGLYESWKSATNWSTYADYISNKNPATFNFTISPSGNSIVYVNSKQIQGTSTSWVGPSASYIVHDTINNVVLPGIQTGITEGAIINITADLTTSSKITLSTGVTGLTVKFTVGGVTFNATDEGSGNYSINVVGSETTVDYLIEGGSNYIDVSGSITTTGSDITKAVKLTPATEASFVRPNLTADGTLGGNSFAVYSPTQYSNPYEAVDNSASTYWGYWAASGNQTYIFYNPDALKVTEIIYTYYSSSYRASAIVIQGSNDNSNWADITSTLSGSNATYTSTLINDKYYKYYKLTFTPYSGDIRVSDMAITAIYKTPAA